MHDALFELFKCSYDMQVISLYSSFIRAILQFESSWSCGCAGVPDADTEPDEEEDALEDPEAEEEEVELDVSIARRRDLEASLLGSQ